MFAKLIAFIVLLFIIYVLSIFTIPDIADEYGNALFNAQIRALKDQSLQFASGSESAGSIADKIVDVSRSITEDAKEVFVSGSELTNTLIDTTKVIIDETRDTIENTEKVVNQKTEQAKQVVDSANQAYDAVEKAKEDFRNLTNFTGSLQ